MAEGTTKEEMHKRVDMLLELMGMSHVRASIVGDGLHKGISGGQLKRLSIAVEIVALPNLISLDEPTSGDATLCITLPTSYSYFCNIFSSYCTSGLDSSIAFEVMAVVRKLANQNRTCISTIHQPSPEVFALFDMVVLMSSGRLVYFGPVDDVLSYFTSADMGYKYPQGQNPAEFMIDVSNGQIFPHSLKVPRHPEELESLFRRSKYNKEPLPLSAFASAESADKKTGYTSEQATTIVTQSRMLLARTWLSAIRDTKDQLAQVCKNLIVGTLIGIVFFKQASVTTPLFTNDDKHTPNADVSNVSSLLFFSMCYCLMSNLQAIPYLCTRNHVYRREIASNAYVPFPYWLAQCVTNIPLLLCNHFCFVMTMYFLAGFPTR